MSAQTRSTAAFPDLSELAASWRRTLRAQNKSPRTVQGYLEGLSFFARYLRREHDPVDAATLTREHVEGFMAEQLERHRPSTVRTRYRSLQQFFRWLVGEGEIRLSPMVNMTPPAVPEEPPQLLTDEQVECLLRACEGRGFAERRDMAVLRLFIDCGMRLAELTHLSVADVELDASLAIVLGKGRRPRVCPFGSKTASAIDRYLRRQAAHRLAARSELWLGHRGPMTDSGIRRALRRRALEAGVPGVHPHLFRHGFAHRWLVQGGQETDLMRLAGWRSRTMVSRYGASAADERAREAYRRLKIGEHL